MAKARKQKKPDHLKRILDALEANKLAQVREILAALHPADVAHALEGLTPEPRVTVWAQVDVRQMGEVLLELPEAVRVDLVQRMDDEALIAAARTLDTDDIADLIPDLSDEVIAEILSALDKQDRQRLGSVLSYPEDTAGGLMNVDAVTVRENITLEVVLRYLRRRGELPEHTNQLFVVDRGDRVVGALPVARLLTTETRARVSRVMERDVVKFATLAPDKDVAAAFENYNLISAPVVDDNNRLLGRITVDDVVDVIRALADRQVMAPAGLSEEQDIFAPVARSTRQRAMWLGVNLVTAFIASWVIGLFEQTIEKVVAVAVLMPIVASMGGNAGTQTLTLVVRGLAMGTISESNARRVLTRELMIGAVNGLIWALVVALVTVLWFHHWLLGMLIGVAMIINLVFAALSGVLIPLLLRKFGVDPALASAVILTTVTDVIGFFAFLGLATLFLI
ncbi:MAG: magnesium transporter [Sulfuricaulis sp.]